MGKVKEFFAGVKNPEEIENQIRIVTDGYRHVLTIGCATVFENAPRAMMQLEAQTKLDALYWVLGKTRPRFKCDTPPVRS